MIKLNVIVIFLSQLCNIKSAYPLGSFAKFDLVLVDKIQKSGIFKEKKVADESQCASYCMAHKICKGFGIDANSMCRLIDLKIETAICSAGKCSSYPGMKIYRHISRNRYLTSDSKGTFHSSENNMIDFSNIVVGPLRISIFKAECGDHPLTGFSSEFALFEGSPFSMIFCNEKLSLKERPKKVLNFNGDEPALCNGTEDVISELEIHETDGDLESIVITCVHSQQIILEDGSEFIGIGNGQPMADCPRGSLMTGVAVRMIRMISNRYFIQVTCKNIDSSRQFEE
ncbi:hypothetical protein JTE90_004311 [Oedothorax gibbosus]|uniref:Apple domain-containing protein n=1 Tax=Oedothorax gibbosus TaxID=931172 RepID=A0AAV6VMJ1_9ARAC|nr:hypothetical protein JTE90_004311 [Oedothorax gibbosus]